MQKNPRIVYGLQELDRQVRGGVMTIGNFDGVHRGHQRILAAARALADEEGGPVVAMTFEPPPDLVLRPQDAPKRLTPTQVKAELLLQSGADWVVVVKTDAMLLAMAPEEFIDRLVVRHFAPRHVVEGPNFFFGLARSGNVRVLTEAGAERGFSVRVIESEVAELSTGPQRISSTLVRDLVAAGKVEDAQTCLGRPFSLHGRVVAGQGQGRVLQFPTANLDPGEQVVPADGVYAGKAKVAARRYAAAVSIGCKPTLGPSPRTVEAFLIDAEGDFYGKDMVLTFIQRLRGQEKFAGLEALAGQIAEDVQRVRDICR
jgi:riboflavin kinase/FMN adenylyltransferase